MWSESLQAATRGQGAEQPCRQHMVVGRTEKECVSKTVRTKIRQNVRLVSSSPLRHLSSGRASEAQGLCTFIDGALFSQHTEILLQENTERKAHRIVTCTLSHLAN